MERPARRSLKCKRQVWSCAKELLWGGRWEISVIASCLPHSSVSTSLLPKLSPSWAGFLSENAVWKAVGARREAGVASGHKHQCFCDTEELQWPRCEKWDCSFHALSSWARWPWANKQLGAAARPYQRQEQQGAFCWEVRQARQVFWLKTQPAKVREHRSESLFFFLLLNGGLDFQASNWCNSKRVTPN